MSLNSTKRIKIIYLKTNLLKRLRLTSTIEGSETSKYFNK